jgi:hypothetical protein
MPARKSGSFRCPQSNAGFRCCKPTPCSPLGPIANRHSSIGNGMNRQERQGRQVRTGIHHQVTKTQTSCGLRVTSSKPTPGGCASVSECHAAPALTTVSAISGIWPMRKQRSQSASLRRVCVLSHRGEGSLECGTNAPAFPVPSPKSGSFRCARSKAGFRHCRPTPWRPFGPIDSRQSEME